MSVDSLLSRVNPVIGWLLRSPLHGVLSRGLMLLAYRGRKTGRRIEIPVGYQRDGDTLTVLASEANRKRWWRNFREPGDVECRIRGSLHAGRAQLVEPTSDLFCASVERTLRRLPATSRVFRVRFDSDRGLTRDQIEQLRREVAVVRIELEPTGRARSD